MGIEFRTALPDEFEAAVVTIGTAFLERNDWRAVADSIRGFWDPARTWLAWDGHQVAGTFRSWGTQLTVPGGAQLPAAAVAAVTVRPTHRRRGIMTRLAALEHAALRERGEAVALLNAAEFPIYGRLGYAPGTWNAAYAISTRATSFAGSASGTIELVASDTAARDRCRGVFERWRVGQPGEIWRRDVTWDLALGLVDEPWGERWKGFVAVHLDDLGMADGYVRYRAEGKWDGGLPAGIVDVNELHALGPDVEDDLVRFLLGLDLVSTIKLSGRRLSERFAWRMDNQRALRTTEVADGLWVRLFDVPRALSARTYDRTDRVVLEVVDDEAYGGTVRLLLDAGPDGATCVRTDRPPDLTIPVRALSASYRGGTRLAHVAVATGADEHTANALARADALFRTLDPPWCSTFF
jgi:predicted acetyltransferase